MAKSSRIEKQKIYQVQETMISSQKFRKVLNTQSVASMTQGIMIIQAQDNITLWLIKSEA